MSQPFPRITPAQICWQDGILFSTKFNDVYFSRENAVAESEHVFIHGNNLIDTWRGLHSSSVYTIAETGFGTGLNFLLALKYWIKYAPDEAKLNFYSCEKHPLLLDDMIKAAAFWPELSELAQTLHDQYPPIIPGFHHLSFLSGRVHLILIFEDAVDAYQKLLLSGSGEEECYQLRGIVDSWFLDGFAPSKNSDMWSTNLFQLIGRLSHVDSSLTTFSCARAVKDGLNSAGFTYKKVAGFGSKREMICARSTNNLTAVNAFKRQSVWQIGHYQQTPNRTAIVIGAGLAGSMIAYQLAENGFDVTVIDKNPRPGEGASGNPRTVLFPSFSAYQSPLSELMLQSYHFASKFYAKFDLTHVEHQFSGMIQINTSIAEDHVFQDWIKQLSPMVSYKTAAELSVHAGVELMSDGLWLPEAGWINSAQFCLELLNHPRIQFAGSNEIDNLQRVDNQWYVNGYTADVVILASGWTMKSLPQAKTLPLRAMKGQMTLIAETPASKKQTVPICGNGHILPSYDGVHYLGATFEVDNTIPGYCTKANEKNLEKLKQLPIKSGWDEQTKGQWVGIRTSVNDYLPIVGALPKYDVYIETYAHLAKDVNWLTVNNNPFEPNLYAFTGFGSKGLTTIPLCAKYLANLISHQALIFPSKLVSALAPARFLRRKIMRREIVV